GFAFGLTFSLGRAGYSYQTVFQPWAAAGLTGAASANATAATVAAASKEGLNKPLQRHTRQKHATCLMSVLNLPPSQCVRFSTQILVEILADRHVFAGKTPAL